MVILQERQPFCKEENRLLDYHHKLAQIYRVADGLGKEALKREMERVRQKYTFLESLNLIT